MVSAPASIVHVASLATTCSLLGAASAVGDEGLARPSLDAHVSSLVVAVAARVSGSGDATAASGGIYVGFKFKRRSGDRGFIPVSCAISVKRFLAQPP
ncbi:hypothetical protein SUGI_1009130 [Cryptomeria japonica]|nr:hypothetical protein SUGI_1009130 [Cryptomeria japonica]